MSLEIAKSADGDSRPARMFRHPRFQGLVHVARWWPALAQAALAGVGSGLVGTIVVIYLVRALGVAGLGVSLVLAAPGFVGAARVAAVRYTRRPVARKRFCILASLGGALVLLALPTVALNIDPTSLWGYAADLSIAGIVALWCGYHLLDYMGTVALWSWLKAIVDGPHLGTFIGVREFCFDGARALAMLAGGLWAFPREIESLNQPQTKAMAYAMLAIWGALAFLAAALMLVFLPAAGAEESAAGAEESVAGDGAPSGGSDAPSAPAAAATARSQRDVPGRSQSAWRETFAMFSDSGVAPLMTYGCWFSFFNGFTQAAQNLFPINILDLSLLASLYSRSATSWGQSLASPFIGRHADRHGIRNTMIVCQVIVGLGLAGFLFANEFRIWPIGFAWAAWIAYAGINIGVPKLLLDLAPPGRSGAAIAAYFATTGVVYGVSTVLGGFAFDMLRGQAMRVLHWELDRYQYFFYLGIITRVMGAALLLRVPEPRKKKAIEEAPSVCPLD